jgi:hypothetical protein
MVVGLIGLLIMTSFANPSFAADEAKIDEIWEYSPYNLQVWVAMDFAPGLNEQLYQRIARHLPQMAGVVDHSGWRMTVEKAPLHFRASLLRNMDDFEFSPAEMDAYSIDAGDKMMLVAVSATKLGFHIAVREYDCRTVQWSDPVHQDVYLSDDIPVNIFEGIKQAFVPLARVITAEDDSLTALVRAGGLLIVESETPGQFVRNTGSPVWIDQNEICLPIQKRAVRKKDPDGKGSKTVTLTSPIEWTYAVVNNVNTEKDEPMLECGLYSAMRAPMGGKRKSRTERILRVAKANNDSTTLYLTNRDKIPKPVNGYELHQRLPGSTDSVMLGKTDWEGSYTIAKGEHRLVLVFVRSGSRLLARLPIVPGLYKQETAAMFSDDERIRAEGIKRAMQQNLLAYLSQRISLSIQIRDQLRAGNVEEADQLMSRFRLIRGSDEFLTQMEIEAGKLRGKDEREQGKINAMFNELRALILKSLGPKLGIDLNREIEHVRNGGKYEDLTPDPLSELEDAKGKDAPE